MILIGILLLVIGAVTGIGLLWTLGLIVIVIGLVLLLLGLVHPVGPRRWYWLQARSPDDVPPGSRVDDAVGG